MENNIKQYEYKVICSIESIFIDKNGDFNEELGLNELGKDGWKLVSVQGITPHRKYYYFIKEK